MTRLSPSLTTVARVSLLLGLLPAALAGALGNAPASQFIKVDNNGAALTIGANDVQIDGLGMHGAWATIAAPARTGRRGVFQWL